MQVQECSRPVRTCYHPANQGICASTVHHTFDVPDLESFAGPKRQLKEIVGWCRSELKAYCWWLGKNPDQRDSISSLALLPQDLLAEEPPPELKAAIATLESELADSRED